jgi:predicted Zn finger-like uncharacterized protein
MTAKSASMIIVCPKCDRRYLTNESDFTESGRDVRCSGCGHHWFHEPTPTPEVVEPLYADINPTPFHDKPEERRSFKLLLVLIVMGLIVAGLYTGRQRIFEVFPQTAKFFQLLGFEKRQIETALVLEHMTPLYKEGEGHQLLILVGEVRNLSDETHQLPPLIIQIKGPCRDASWLARLFNNASNASGSCVIDEWSHEWSEARLPPGEVLKFETAPRVVRETAESIHSHF